MGVRLTVVLLSLALTSSVFAKEVFLAVSGTANNVFFSDARIFNPADKEITIQAYYLPRGNGSNAGATPVSFTVGSRQVRFADDIVKNILQRGDVGGIRFVSPDDFVVTQRVYALTTANCGASSINPCTLGQFVQGLDVSAAIAKGVILQLKSNDKFRTNVGALNPNAVPATVTWRLYDKNNALVSTGTPIVMPPYATIGPTGLTSSFFFNAGTADLSDAWVSFTSDKPIFAYGSVVDNASTDQTYVPASADSGTPAPPQPTVKTVTITATSGEFNFSGPPLARGDRVSFVATGTGHGIRLFDPDGNIILTLDPLGNTPTERTITLEKSGNFPYICTRPACSPEHSAMFGELPVQ